MLLTLLKERPHQPHPQQLGKPNPRLRAAGSLKRQSLLLFRLPLRRQWHLRRRLRPTLRPIPEQWHQLTPLPPFHRLASSNNPRSRHKAIRTSRHERESLFPLTAAEGPRTVAVVASISVVADVEVTESRTEMPAGH